MTSTWIVMLLLACNSGKIGDGDGTTGDGGADGGTDGGGTTEEQGWCGVLQVINSQCTGCHDSESPGGELDLVTDPYAALVDQPSAQFDGLTLVVPGDAASSFLMAKVEGTQGGDQGGAMPPSDGLDADGVATIREWIDAGASPECTDPGTTTPVEPYHPDGFASPDVHGLEAKLHEQTCTDCHGEDLTGGSAGVSCDTCHEAGWRTDCTYCHGGMEDATGAPPEDIDDGEADAAFGAHPRHVQENTHAAFDCTQCHVKPTDVLSAGHLFDDSPAQAEVSLSAGLSDRGAWSTSAMECSNLYCHGDGQGDNGRVLVADAPLSCDACHADRTSSRADWGDMSGEHEEHLDEGVGCQECHADTTSNGSSILEPALHVNGEVDVVMGEAGITWNGSSCTGTCHGEDHRGEGWR